ncbi:MAG: hypothetical protein ACI8SJ_001088 [Shewanella sp.]|jgi:hypothetical protein
MMPSSLGNVKTACTLVQTVVKILSCELNMGIEWLDSFKRRAQ